MPHMEIARNVNLARDGYRVEIMPTWMEQRMIDLIGIQTREDRASAMRAILERNAMAATSKDKASMDALQAAWVELANLVPLNRYPKIN